MPFDLVGATSQVDPIKAMADKLTGVLQDRIKPVSVIMKSADEMPRRSDGGPAFGYWKSPRREIWLWDEADDYPVGKTLAHEAMHVLDSDWLTRSQRTRLLELMSPLPTAWSDQRIAGIVHRYVALPSEVFAVYASAALGGIERPAYRSLFRRRIAKEQWKTLRDLTLADDGPGEEEPVVEVVPSPPDPLDEVSAQLQAAQELLAQALAAKQAAEDARNAAESRLAKARAKAAEITAL